jgi:hypothetical protein
VIAILPQVSDLAIAVIKLPPQQLADFSQPCDLRL